MINKIYCEGTQCSKRDNCALHCVVAQVNMNILIGQLTAEDIVGCDKEGKSHIETWTDCGDEGNFKKFTPLN